MDFRLTVQEELQTLAEKLAQAMPEGLRAISVYENGRKAKELKWLRVQGRLEYDQREPESLCQELRKFYSQEQIVIEKKTKRGLGQSNIAPAIRDISFLPGEQSVLLEAVISAQEPTLNPEYLIGALRQLSPELAPDFAEFCRQEVYDSQMRVFR